jgi:magnesium chelatase family protein
MEKSYSLNSAYYFCGSFIPVRVTTEIETGIGIHVVGIRDEAVKVILLHAVTAMQNLGYTMPGKKVIVTVAQNGIGARYYGKERPKNAQFEALELAIALSIIIADGQLACPETEPILYAEEADATFNLSKAIRKIKEGLL